VPCTAEVVRKLIELGQKELINLLNILNLLIWYINLYWDRVLFLTHLLNKL